MNQPPPVSAELIERAARELQHRPVAPDRAAELAGEVDRINRQVAAEADRLHDFFDDPFQFVLVLERLKAPPRG